VDTTASPSFDKVLGTVAKALRLLGQEGVDAESFSHLIINDIAFRRQLAAFCLSNDERYMPGLPDQYHPQALASLIIQIVGHSNYTSEYYDLFVEQLPSFTRHMVRRDLAIIVLRFGLADGISHTLDDLAEHFGVGRERIRQLESRALGRIFHALQKFERAAALGSFEGDLTMSVDILDLSERARYCLRRVQINTLAELCDRTEDDLLAITNFGQKSLDEVKAKLAELGLSLKI
jgi:hypothetical protein